MTESHRQLNGGRGMVFLTECLFSARKCVFETSPDRLDHTATITPQAFKSTFIFVSDECRLFLVSLLASFLGPSPPFLLCKQHVFQPVLNNGLAVSESSLITVFGNTAAGHGGLASNGRQMLGREGGFFRKVI